MLIRKKLAIAASMPIILLAVTLLGFVSIRNETSVREPGKTISVAEGNGRAPEKIPLQTGAASRHEHTEIYGWLDENKMVVAKDIQPRGTMTGKNRARAYPRNLYIYDRNSDEYEPLLDHEGAVLGGAKLSPDGNHLIYQARSQGVPVYNVMNLETMHSFSLSGDVAGHAISPSWAEDGTIIGSTYEGGAYTATTTGEIETIMGLEHELPMIFAKAGNRIYYHTGHEESLKTLNLRTNETKDTGLDGVVQIVVSPDAAMLLALQYGPKTAKLLWCDIGGGNLRTIAEGKDIGGISWSPNQRRIAYYLKSDAIAEQGLYVHEIQSGRSTRISSNVASVFKTAWSPSGNELAFAETKEGYSYSGIVRIEA